MTVTLGLLPLALATAAIVASLVNPAVDRWGWAAGAALVALWVAVAADAAVGGILLVAALAGGLIDNRGQAVAADFSSIVWRLAALTLALMGALVLVVRLLALDAGLNPEVVLLSAIAIAALLQMTARSGPAAEARAARVALVAATAAWAVTGHPSVVAAAAVAATLVLLALAGRGGLERLARPFPFGPAAAVSALALAALVVLLLPGDASLGGADAGVSLRGLSREVALGTVWVLAAGMLAAAALRQRSSLEPWIVAAGAVIMAVLRLPVGLAGLLLVAAIVVPRLAHARGAAGWSRTLLLGAIGAAAVVAAGVNGRIQGDDAIAAALALGFLALAAAAPFGLHAVRWMEDAPPQLGAVVGGAFLPAAIAALVGAVPALAQVHAGPRTGLVLGIFGGVTAVAGAIYALGATSWHSLAVRTTPCEVGLALVAVGAFTLRGLQGAALTLALLAITRPVLLYADALSPRQGAGMLITALALLGAAGLPPTLGFPARVLVFSAAARLGPPIAGLAVTAVLLEVAAIATVLRRRLAVPAGGLPRTEPAPLRVLATITALAVLGGGIFPTFMLRYAFQLGG
jgi:hypothetical protein